MDLNLGSTRALIDECRRHGLLRNQAAYVLGTTFHETAHTMKPIYERGKKSYFDKYDAGTAIGKRLGNIHKGDGYLYRGRGYIQITGRANYTKFGLRDNPDGALDPATAAHIAVTGMREGTFTGKKLGTYVNADKADYFNARAVINGDKNVKVKGNKASNGQMIASYAREYDMDLQVSGYGPKKPASTQPAPLATIPPIVPKIDPAPEPATDESVIAAAQARLKELGYNPGGIEGTFGPLTKDAVLSFRHDNGLPVSEVIDSEFLTALAVATPRKMIPARANAKPSEVTALVPEARHNWLSKITAGGLGGTAGAGALVDGVLKNVTDAKSYVNEFTDYLAAVPGWAWCLAILAVAGFIYWKSQQSEDASVEAFKTGDRR